MGFIPILEITILGTYFWNFVQGSYADLRSSWFTGQQASIPFIRVFIGGRAIIRQKNSVTFPYVVYLFYIISRINSKFGCADIPFRFLL